MKKLTTLKPGDSVEVIAPASRCSDEHLKNIVNLLSTWELDCIVNADIFGEDILCANTDEMRFKSLKNALFNPKTKAVICARGGYGSLRLIPELSKIAKPSFPKLFVGMSDITALNLFFENHWQWPTLHGALAVDKFSQESIAAMKKVMFGEATESQYSALPLNQHAEKQQIIKSSITGGNLCVTQAGIGTAWQIQPRNKIIFFEEVSERGYRVDRMLEHLRQAGAFKDAAAIVFGDFILGNEPDGSCLIPQVLKRFAQQFEIPVVQIAGIGHGHTNFPLPLGTNAELRLGSEIKLIC